VPQSTSAIATSSLPAGDIVPVLGLGTWGMGEDSRRAAQEIAALQLGIDLGMTLVDTAEMYGDGATEDLLGRALPGRRDKIYLVSKVLPSNASRTGTIAACERSLKRMKTDHIDLYLLHWRGSTPFERTIEAFEQLIAAGKIRRWGVSNLDPDDMEELLAGKGGAAVQTDQVLYNPSRRGIEFDLLPMLRQRKIPVMAYSPVEQGRILKDRTLIDIAKRHAATPAQVALAWALRDGGVIAIPKAADVAHVRDNRAALDIKLTAQDVADIDRVFPPPKKARPLEML
jgi:diketogulonate reductase-like aldo/keto reductase